MMISYIMGDDKTLQLLGWG